MLARCSFHLAARLRADTLAAIERAGFAENFDP